nr:retrovirus-related Pol polyprotein from transposon TNT 1-94 [Tanacetum cinerariifolium]
KELKRKDKSRLVQVETLRFCYLENDDGIIVTLKGVRYSPKLKKNLISIGTLESKGFEVRENDRVMKIISGVLVVIKEAVKLWHMHLGHAREKSLNFLIKQGLLKGLSSCKLDLCEHCINEKTTMAEVLGVFIKWKKMMETQTCRKIKHLQTNNGEEYKNDLFTKFYEDKGIVRHFTVRHTPQQNGVAKRMNRALLEKVRCMLSNAGLGKEFWAEAVTYACHLVNRFPLIAINRKTPFEKWYGKPATDYDSLHFDLELVEMDVKTAFLHGDLKEEIYMVQLEGFKVSGKEHEVFKHGSSQWVEGYCDSDYAGDLDKRRSMTGYVFTMAKALISWKSTLQSTTALSTTEAEYMAMTEAVKEAIWLQGLLGELGIKQKFVTMHSDRQSAIHLAKNQVYHARAKHIDVRYHFIREILKEGGVKIQKIHTFKNPADMLTKVVAGIKLTYCLDLINNDDGIIVTLKGVRYSPKLKKNLISIGTLESKGFEVRENDRVMKIISGVLVVIKGIRKINNTYYYKGRTIVGTIAAITDGDINSEAVKLWHMHLGHAREKSLNFLIKQGLLKDLVPNITTNLAFVKTGLAQLEDVGSTNVDVEDTLSTLPSTIL